MSLGGLNKKGRTDYMGGAVQRYEQLLPEREEEREVLSELNRLIQETKNLVKDISIKEKGIQKSKRKVLHNIYRIITEHLSELDRKYQTNLVLFIEETFELQKKKTNYHDAKILELLASHSMGSLLDQDISGILSSLKSIAYIKQSGSEDLVADAQKNLLKRLELEKLTPIQVAQEIEQFKKKLQPPLKVINEVPKEWMVVAPRTGSKIELKGFQKQEHQQDLLKLLETINSDNLEQFLKFSESLKNG